MVAFAIFGAQSVEQKCIFSLILYSDICFLIYSLRQSAFLKIESGIPHDNKKSFSIEEQNIPTKFSPNLDHSSIYILTYSICDIQEYS